MKTAKDYSPMSVCLVAASTGILLASLVFIPQRMWYALLGFFFLVWIVTRSFRTDRTVAGSNSDSLSGRNRIGFIATLAIAGMIFAFFGQRYTQRIEQWLDDEQMVFQSGDETLVIAEAWLCSMSELRLVHTPFQNTVDELVEQTVFNAQLKQLRRDDSWIDCHARVRVAVSGNHTALRPGDRVRLWGKARKITGPGNPGQFDQRRNMQTQGIVALIRIENPDGVALVCSNECFRVKRCLERMRSLLQGRFSRWIPEENRALACAMVLGLRNDLDPEVKDMFRRTGTMHILAISGMHIGLITTLLFFVLKLLLVPRRVVCVLVIVFVIVYTAMTGGQPPAVRAALFLCVVFMGILLGYPVSPVNTLALTALGILLLNPFRLFDVGAHLSFIAVGSFLWIPSIKNQLNPARKDSSDTRSSSRTHADMSPKAKRKRNANYSSLPVRKIVELFRYNFFVWLVLTPLMFQVGNIVTPVAIVINPIVWPALWSAVFFSFLLVGCSGILSFLQPLVGTLTGFFYGLVADWIAIAHSCPLGYFYVPSPPGWWLAGFYLPLAFWTLFPGLCPSKRKVVYFILFWICFGLCCSFLHTASVKRNKTLEVVTFSVGHGNAILTSFPDKRNVLYDCGSFSSPRVAGETVAKYILNGGKRHVDLLILSHPDTDHFNAVEFLLETIDIQAVAVPSGMFLKQDEHVRHLENILRKKRIPVREMIQGESLDFAGFPELSVLHPPRIPEYKRSGSMEKVNSNAMSLVVMLRYLERKILLTGDLDTDSPQLHNRIPEKIDILFAPHHGGKSRNTVDLVRRSNPDYIFVSEGSFRTDKKLLERIGPNDARILNTFRDGAIFVTVSKGKAQDLPGNLVVHSWRNRLPVIPQCHTSTARAAAP